MLKLLSTLAVLSLVAPHHTGAQGAAAIRQQRLELDRTVWSDERRAQQYEAVFVSLWDRLRVAQEARSVLTAFPFDQLLLGSPQDSVKHDWDIVETHYGGPPRTLDHGQWSALLEQWEDEGFVLEQSEWHHKQFIPTKDGPPRSLIDLKLHVKNHNKRLIVSGDLSVTWSEQQNEAGHYIPATINASNLTLTERRGTPTFTSSAVLADDIALSPLIAADLDGDGLDDLLALGANLLYRNQGGRFVPEPLLAYPPPVGRIEVALLADFTGDGAPDLIVGGPGQLLGLYEGGKDFDQPGLAIATRPLQYPEAMSAGDIDGDGDLDLWIGQYRLPYREGQMPTPYYDANDGYPAYLLSNDGRGRFTDITARAGLEAKRKRRTYSGSLADLDGDDDLDLLVVSDFAGIDLYYNDGTGTFVDVTARTVSEASTFGMSHVFGDYNADDRLDMYVVGMSSTTARRLDYLNLGREEYPEHHQQRRAMGFGNRLYLGREGTQFSIAPSTEQVARTGWSWGVASADFDNDGDDEIYVANGHLSGETAQDYCTTFWTHDIYTGGSEPDPQIAAFFDEEIAEWHNAGISWNGFEHNKLYLSGGGRSFVEIGYLMGVAFEFDARTVLDMDIDADGRVDLLVSEWSGTPRRERVHVLRNVWPGDNNWLGVRLQGAAGISPIGARITLRSSQGTKTQWVYTGESFDAQRSPTRLFGLGHGEQVEAVEVQWFGGQVTSLSTPQINRYHELTP
ncbi:MAG: CRTAC1 family protein [Gemmatimonadetes bacterium]|nr:CRTAC1 family protein [Gemmatimonadota bacterium]MYC71767.1 CRTAC1 family protein [Gemmatimonadota bacterium]MYI63258.1 CRTAC1 family protein [Gemmatimonadota bacterium]